MKSKIHFLEKLGYGSGELAGNLVQQTIALFFVNFLTDRFGLLPFEAGLIFLIGKIWDAASCTFMGLIIDRTKSRWGAKRPYLLFGAVPLGLAFFLVFLGPPVPDQGRFLYSLLTYLALSTFIVLVTIPHGSLTASMTLDSTERSGISAWRMGLGLVGVLVAGGATPALTGLLGWPLTAGIYAVLVVPLVLAVFFSVRERVAAPQEGFSLKVAWETIRSNPPFLFLSLACLFLSTGLNLLASNLVYYIIYFQGDYSVATSGGPPVFQVGLGQTLAFAALFVTAIFLMPVFHFLSKRFSKRTAFQIGLVVMIFMLLGLFLAGKNSYAVLIPLFVAGSAGIAVMFLSPWSMVPDTVEYSQWKTGQRRDGVLYGLFYLVFRIAAGLGGFVTGMALTFFGYHPNVTQTPEAAFGILTLETLVPLILFVVGALILFFYPINRTFHEKILQDLALKEGPQK